jgi:hypothetical protein
MGFALALRQSLAMPEFQHAMQTVIGWVLSALHDWPMLLGVGVVVWIVLAFFDMRSDLVKIRFSLEKIFELLNDETGWARKKSDSQRRYEESLRDSEKES